MISIITALQVVPPKSATLERYSYKTIHSDHINMTRFWKRDDSYQKVSIEIRRWINDMVQDSGRTVELKTI